MPQQEIEAGAKGVVQLLAASANANFADKIAKALLRAGYQLDPGAFDPDRIDAVIVLWTGVALDKPALIDVARAAWKANRLTPVSIGRVEPPFGSRATAPMDLAGWRGDDGDPRWRFVLSDIDALRARARLNGPVHAPKIQAPKFQAQKIQDPQAQGQETQGAEVQAPEAAAPIDPFTDEVTAVHHPARTLWRKRLLPAAPIAAGLAGLLIFAAGASFMVGSLSSRPAPIERAVASAPVVATEPAKEVIEEEPSPEAKLALVRLAPGVAPPAENNQHYEATDGAPAVTSVAPSSAETDGFGTDIVLESSPDSIPFEDGLKEEEGLQGLAVITAPSLKPANIEASPEQEAEALNQAALLQLAAAAAMEAEAGEEAVSTMSSGTIAEISRQSEEAQPASIAPPSGATFSDCTSCPNMATLKGGVFLMGARADEQNRQPEEAPQHRVEIGYGFAIATREVTFDQWMACVVDGGCREYAPDDMGWGRGGRPVINVSHEDASAYARWLSAKTGHYYRLPSEAEWEYAARAGTGSAFHFGDVLSSDSANFDGRNPYGAAAGIFRERTVSAGEFARNGFGLFGIHGNVWEWTLDCWTANHMGAPASGAARSDGDCARRVVKGGAWNTPGWRLRSAHRRGVYEDQRKADTGFRVVRALD